MGGAPGGRYPAGLAVRGQPHHPTRPPPHFEQHLQQCGRSLRGRLRRRVPLRRLDEEDAAPQRAQPRRPDLGARTGAHSLRMRRRRARRVRLRLRPTRGVDRRPLLRHVVQLVPRPDDRHRVDAGLRDVPPARECLSSPQPQRRPLPPQAGREVRDALPSLGRRAHTVRRDLLQREPRPPILGSAPSRARPGSQLVAGDEDRRRACTDRDVRRVAARLPRRAHELQRLRLFRRSRIARPGRAVARRCTSGAVRARSDADYERTGDVPNVVFPCAMLCDAPTGRLAIYYGAADTAVAVAFSYVDELVRFALEHAV